MNDQVTALNEAKDRTWDNAAGAPLSEFDFDLIKHDGILAWYRGRHRHGPQSFLLSQAASANDETEAAKQLGNEFALRDLLEPAWSLKPRAAVIRNGSAALLYDDANVVPLDQQPAWLLDIENFLRQAICITGALRQAHENGLLHRNIKPSNILVDATGGCRLAGFGLALRAAPGHTEGAFPMRSGTLAYMSPEHTGRTRRGTDARSDLYSLGVTLYEMLTGRLPFNVDVKAESSEWIHRHLAGEPDAPQVALPAIPLQLSSLILRLLAKNPDSRYQTAASLENDLERCLRAWRTAHRIEDFALGISGDSLRFSKQLYAREAGMKTLLQAFDRVVSTGARTRVTIRGHSGVGKSALLAALQNELRLKHASIAAGKADQYRKDLPYAALTEALRCLVMDILGRSESEVRHWRQRLLQALGDYGKLAVSLIPQLELLTGVLQEVTELPAQDTQIRFQAVIQRMFAALAAPGRPLVLLLDDLQWIDASTMQLLAYLMDSSLEMPLLLVTSERTGGDSQNAMQEFSLAGMHIPDTRRFDLDLTGLDTNQIKRLLADTLGSPTTEVHELARLVHEKTRGNPLFVRQFLKAIADDGLLIQDSGSGRWEWNLTRIHECGYTDNVAALVLQRLGRLPARTQSVLAGLASLGRHTGPDLLAAVHDMDRQTMQKVLAPAVSAEVLIYSGDEYRFCHDRVQEAAYLLMGSADRLKLHLAAGRQLLVSGDDAGKETLLHAYEHIVVAWPLITDPEEMHTMARAGLQAARKARLALAYQAALTYANTGLALATGAGGNGEQQLLYLLMLEQAECQLITGLLVEADENTRRLLEMSSLKNDRAAAYRLKTEIHLRRSEIELAVETALQGLGEFGLPIQPRPLEQECAAAYREVRRMLGKDPEGVLLALPPMHDTEVDAVMALLSVSNVPASFTCDTLHFLQLCHMLRLTIKHGMSGPSTAALAWFGVLVGHRYGDYADGFMYGRLARTLVTRNRYFEYEAKTILPLDQLSVWTQPLSYSVDCVKAGFAAGVANGDITTACFECCHQVANLLTRGDHLDEVKAEAEHGLRFVRHAQFRDVETILTLQLRYVENLRGQELNPFSGNALSLSDLAITGEDRNRMSTLVFWFWLYKGISHYLAAETAQARSCMSEAESLAWSAPGHIHLLDYDLYHALSLAAEDLTAGAHARRVAGIQKHHAKLKEWAEINPASFADKAMLVAGELARLDGDAWGAQQLYAKAIAHAEEHGFVQYAAVAHELASRLSRDAGLHTSADAHLKAASSAYRCWGAEAKSAWLEQRYPQLLQARSAGHQATVAIAETAESRDLISVIRSVRALSEELELDSLIRVLMTIAIQHAGAQRGLLVRMSENIPFVSAIAETVACGVQVEFARHEPSPRDLPLSMLQTAIRTSQVTGIAGMSRQNAFESDPYLQDKPLCAAMCLPLIRRTELTGVLYLENRHMPDVFTGEHAHVLQILAAQAAISLEIATLYADLVKENLQRRSVEATLRAGEASLELGEQISHTGSWRWDSRDDTLTCSAGFCRIFGIDEDRRVIPFSEFTAYIYPDDRSIVLDAVRTSTLQRKPIQVEYRILLTDGTVRYMVGVGRPAGGADDSEQYVGTVTDVTNRRASEDALRMSQAELARVTRITTVGQLTASIAHEINQPLMSIVSNAGATLRWLDRDPPDLHEARAGLHDIVSEGGRAGHLIRSLQALTRNSEPALGRVNLHETVRHILAICRSELESQSVSVKLSLDAELSDVLADEIQLQQVLLNLVGNAIDALSEVRGRPRVLSLSSLVLHANLIHIRVEDNGIGIDKSVAEKIFDAFYTTKKDGMGMGLAISRSIAEAHHGRLAASAGELNGSVFILELPLAGLP